jgi:hypothetical protein
MGVKSPSRCPLDKTARSITSVQSDDRHRLRHTNVRAFRLNAQGDISYRPNPACGVTTD